MTKADFKHSPTSRAPSALYCCNQLLQRTCHSGTALSGLGCFCAQDYCCNLLHRHSWMSSCLLLNAQMLPMRWCCSTSAVAMLPVLSLPAGACLRVGVMMGIIRY
jgi:hypothetical protein